MINSSSIDKELIILLNSSLVSFLIILFKINSSLEGIISIKYKSSFTFISNGSSIKCFFLNISLYLLLMHLDAYVINLILLSSLYVL
jgi:hypothetical protein